MTNHILSRSLYVLLGCLFAVRGIAVDSPPPGTHSIELSQPAVGVSRAGTEAQLPIGRYIPIYAAKDGLYYLAPAAVIMKEFEPQRMEGGLFVPADPKAPAKCWIQAGMFKRLFPLKHPVAYTISDKVDEPVPPRPRVLPKPNYPFALRRDGITGSATIGLDVTENGDAENVTVVSATRSEFGEAAAKAYRHAKFGPARLHGKPVRAHLEVPVVFDLK